MFGGGGKKRDEDKMKNVTRQVDRETRQNQRMLGREGQQLEALEKKIETDIRAAAKRGDRATAGVLAKQLIQVRNQKTRLTKTNVQLGAMATQTKLAAANVKVGAAVASSTAIMGQMNANMNPQQVAAMSRAFQKESAKMEINEETMNEALEEAFAGSDEEAEADGLVAQVLDEIGIDTAAAMPHAGRQVPAQAEATSSKTKTKADDEDLMERLAGLK